MKQVLITCDTEVGELARDMDEAFDVFVQGAISGERVGVPLINRVASQYGGVVTHFVDVYHPHYEREFSKLCETILADGHQIGLHTHPGSRFGKRYMFEYDVDKQREIIAWGKEWLLRHVGLDVMVHRAGGYGANDAIYPALRASGIRMDSSFFFRASACHMGYPYINRIASCEGIVEFPVTVYREKRTFFGFKRKDLYRKLDFRYGSDVPTILDVIREASDKTIFILFLHSFNFLRGCYDVRKEKFTGLSVHRPLIDAYHALLDGISQLEEVCFTDFAHVQVPKTCTEYLAEKETTVSVQEAITQRIRQRIWKKIPF